MIDVIFARQAVVDLDHVLDYFDQVHLRHGSHQRCQAQLLIELVAPHPLQVVASPIKQLLRQETARIIQRGRIARAHPAVKLHQRFFGQAALITRAQAALLPDRGENVLMIGVVVDMLKQAENLIIVTGLQNLRAGAVVDRRQRAQQNRDGNRALAIELQRNVIALARFKFHPRAAIGNDFRHGQLAARSRIRIGVKVHPRRTNQLRHDDAFGAVVNEGAVLSHPGEFAQEDVVDHVLVSFAIDQRDFNVQAARKSQIAFQAFFLVELGIFKPEAQAKLPGLRAVTGEIQFERTVETLDGRDFIEQFTQAFLNKPVEGIELDLDQVRQGMCIGDSSV